MTIIGERQAQPGGAVTLISDFAGFAAPVHAIVRRGLH